MNQNGTHVGRPAYTPEQRMDASLRQFTEGLTDVGPLRGNHWHTKRKYFLLPDGRKVRKAKFSFIVAHPDHTFGPDDRIYIICDDAECVNPKHMICKGAYREKVVVKELDKELEAKLLAIWRDVDVRTPLARKLAKVHLKRLWRASPIDENHPDIELRMDFFPDDIPDDPEAVRAIAADFGIIMA